MADCTRECECSGSCVLYSDVFIQSWSTKNDNVLMQSLIWTLVVVVIRTTKKSLHLFIPIGELNRSGQVRISNKISNTHQRMYSFVPSYK